MKFIIFSIFIAFTVNANAEKLCDVRPGSSLGVKVIEFSSGNIVHSKMPFKETTPDALLEEMTSLQDMGICKEKIVSRKCTLKFEKSTNTNLVSLFRGETRWSSWELVSKNKAENFLQNLKRVGFCS